MGNEIASRKQKKQLSPHICSDKNYIHKIPVSGSEDPRWKKIGVEFFDIGENLFIGAVFPSNWKMKPDITNNKRVYTICDEQNRDIADVFYTHSEAGDNCYVVLNSETANIIIKEQIDNNIPKSQPISIPDDKNKGSKTSHVSFGLSSFSKSPYIRCNGQNISINVDYKVVTPKS